MLGLQWERSWVVAHVMREIGGIVGCYRGGPVVCSGWKMVVRKGYGCSSRALSRGLL